MGTLGNAKARLLLYPELDGVVATGRRRTNRMEILSQDGISLRQFRLHIERWSQDLERTQYINL